MVVITGDSNLHVDVGSAPGVSCFKDVLTAHDLHQYVDCSTHRCGYTLDLVISRASDSTISNVSVFNSEIYDHKSVTFSVNHMLQEQYPHRKAQLRRDFRYVNSETLKSCLSYHGSVTLPCTFAVNTALDERNSCVGTVLISMQCITFAVTMRMFGQHPTWKYTDKSMCTTVFSEIRKVKIQHYQNLQDADQSAAFKAVDKDFFLTL